MDQISIFESLDYERTFYHAGAMYAEVPKDEIIVSPIKLGDGIIRPGEFVQKFGEKKRTMFEMQEGHYLRYVGKTDKLLLFSPDDYEGNIYYAFFYVDQNTLLIGSQGRMRDIRIQKLRKKTVL
ncbi:hypothetical protein [Peribacillus tepidiphilus]|uniref:hypothetical protein n=1 Tax=Peribacillus tepidiphilus TaxID=2652445 RepID=UPI001291CBCA|nr:hypothetical protein [Peribacillus tepidiphilus]